MWSIRWTTAWRWNEAKPKLAPKPKLTKNVLFKYWCGPVWPRILPSAQKSSGKWGSALFLNSARGEASLAIVQCGNGRAAGCVKSQLDCRLVKSYIFAAQFPKCFLPGIDHLCLTIDSATISACQIPVFSWLKPFHHHEIAMKSHGMIMNAPRIAAQKTPFFAAQGVLSPSHEVPMKVLTAWEHLAWKPVIHHIHQSPTYLKDGWEMPYKKKIIKTSDGRIMWWKNFHCHVCMFDHWRLYHPCDKQWSIMIYLEVLDCIIHNPEAGLSMSFSVDISSQDLSTQS